MRKALSALVGLMLLAAPAFAGECKNCAESPATQGQLAHQLAWRLDLVGEGSTAADAIARLDGFGVAPRGGWMADQNLTNGVLDQVLHLVYGSWDTNFPDAAVTRCQLGSILEKEDEITAGFWHWRDNRWRWETDRWSFRHKL